MRGQPIDRRILDLPAPKHDERDPLFLTWPQTLEFASWLPDDLGRLVQVAALTGARQGELLRLERRHVDLKASTMTITGKTKTAASRRVVDLTRQAARVLRAQLADHDHALVFPSPTGLRMNALNMMRREFRPATVLAGVEGLTFHDLRHTFVSLSARAGNHVSVIARQLGHADGGALLLRRYRHLFPEEGREAAVRLDALLISEARRARANATRTPHAERPRSVRAGIERPS